MILFYKLAAELWALIDVDLDFYAHLAFLQNEKRCSVAIVRSSDNSSFNLAYKSMDPDQTAVNSKIQQYNFQKIAVESKISLSRY